MRRPKPTSSCEVPLRPSGMIQRVSDYQRMAREALRRLVEPACGPSQRLIDAIAELDDMRLLHLASRPELRAPWVEAWTGGQGAAESYESARRQTAQVRSLTAAQMLNLIVWFSEDQGVSVMTRGARMVADGFDRPSIKTMLDLTSAQEVAQN